VAGWEPFDLISAHVDGSRSNGCSCKPRSNCHVTVSGGWPGSWIVGWSSRALLGGSESGLTKSTILSSRNPHFQFKNVSHATAKPLKPTGLLTSLVSQLFTGYLSSCERPCGRKDIGFRSLAGHYRFSPGRCPGVNLLSTGSLSWSFVWGFVTTNIWFSNTSLIMRFRWQDSLGGRVASKVEGLHPTGARADTEKAP
jgi:hypothetical protein